MNVKYYPSHIHVMNNQRHVAGQHAGIVESQLLLCNEQVSAPHLHICASQMPSYEKLLITENANINYHLSGYGLYREESFVKLYGEGIERYALLVAANIWKDRAIYMSHIDMTNKYGEDRVLPWKYIEIFSPSDYEGISKSTSIQRITQDTVVGWLECPSLFDKDTTIFIPMQFLFLGYMIREDLGEKMFMPSFSKGSAAHVNTNLALSSAILEAIEADAFMLNWYTDRKAKIIEYDDIDFIKMVDRILGDTPYDLTLYDFSMDHVPGYVVGAQLVNRNDRSPYVLMGCSANVDIKKAAYRALTEAATIHYLAANGPMMSPIDFLGIGDEKFLNLDSNVAYWTKAEDQEKKKEILNRLADEKRIMSAYPEPASDDSTERLHDLIGSLAGISKYAVFMDITPPEVINTGIKVQRVFIPELVQLSYPGFPYSAHPRVLEYGGITNAFPHPMP